MNKTFLKWAGNKSKVLPQILPLLRGAERIIEPFIGSGSLMLNHEAKEYIGGDINDDLVRVFNFLKSDSDKFIKITKGLFSPEFHGKDEFYTMRTLFNSLLGSTSSEDLEQRAALFIALNKTCFNGLCRYNKHGAFTTPWNHAAKSPKFPENEMAVAAERLKIATVICASFEDTIALAKPGDAVYCDPPYFPKDGKEDAFVDYAKGGFSFEQQGLLVELAEANRKNNIATVISNQDCAQARKLYSGASQVIELDVSRSINRYQNHAETNSAKELLVLYKPL